MIPAVPLRLEPIGELVAAGGLSLRFPRELLERRVPNSEVARRLATAGHESLQRCSTWDKTPRTKDGGRQLSTAAA